MKKFCPLIQLLMIAALERTATVAAAPAQPSGGSLPALYILRGQSSQFRCRLDRSLDVSDTGDLAVSVQDCSRSLDIALRASDVTALAAVLGRMTINMPSFRSVFRVSPEDVSPVFRVNENHPLIRDSSVTVLEGNSTDIVLTVRDRPATEGLCAFCGQVTRTANYEVTDKRRIQVVSQPEARLTLNNQPLPDGYRSDGEVRSGDSFLLACSGSGNGGKVSTRLEKSGRIVASSFNETVAYSVVNASSADSGAYRCTASSDLDHLVQSGQESGSAGVTLLVSFPPAVEVDELVKFTPLGESEDIQVKVSAYPEPRLTCQSKPGDQSVTSSDPSSSGLTVKERYSSSSFYASFTVTFGNLNHVANETLIVCNAENELGSRRVDIRMTALPPTPEIVSSAETNWWNSYDLRWQHHVKANVDFYRIRVIYIGLNNEIINKTEQRLQNFKRTDDQKKRLRQAKDLVFNLSPNTAHNISLQACNLHGCSQFSEHVQVHTPRESAEAYNDPRHPVFAEPQSDGPRSGADRQYLPAAPSQLMSIIGACAILMMGPTL